MKKVLALLLGLLALPALALTNGDNPFTPYTTTHRISVTSSASTAEQVGSSNCQQYKLENESSSKDVWVGFGTASTYTVTVPVAGNPGTPSAATLVKAGTTITVTQIPSAYISAATETGTATLDATCGVGLATGSVGSNITATTTSSGTGDVNLKQVDGITVGSVSGVPEVLPIPSSNSVVGMASTPSTAAESDHVLKAGAGNLYGLTITVGATSGYLMLFNATSAPVDGAVMPAYCDPVISNGTNGGSAVSWNNFPLVFSTGITAVFSTTGCFTKTASATASFFAQVK